MELLNKEGFDLWADQYDEAVRVTEENTDFPFLLPVTDKF